MKMVCETSHVVHRKPWIGDVGSDVVYNRSSHWTRKLSTRTEAEAKAATRTEVVFMMVIKMFCKPVRRCGRYGYER